MVRDTQKTPSWLIICLALATAAFYIATKG
jgi:hypothetical protein